MKKIKLCYLLIVQWLLVIGNSYGQNIDFFSIQKKFEDYAIKHLQEKIFVHTDKNFYLTGETIWMKLYDVDGTFHKPLSINRVAYVEIIGQDGVPVVQTKVGLKDGKGIGKIMLPNLRSGHYVLRAYTQWMRNYSSDFFYHKKLSIANFEEGPVREVSRLRGDKIKVEFFPEGGNLVYTLTSKMAVKIMDEREMGYAANGVIINENKEVLQRFKTNQLGLGSFLFKPQVGHNYTAIVDFEDGRQSIVNIPEINDDGYAFTFKQTSNDSINIGIKRAGKPTDSSLFLLAHTRHFIKLGLEIKLTNDSANVNVSSNSLGEGTTHFTIFDETDRLIGERLYFKFPSFEKKAIVLIDKKNLGEREKVVLNIDEGASRDGLKNLSLSVALLDSLQSNSISDFTSYLLLTSEFKFNTQSFFENLTSKDLQLSDLDNFLLTKKWEKFSWEEVLSGDFKTPGFSPEYEGMVISGLMRDKRTLRPIDNAPLLLAIPGSGKLFSARTNSSGQFSLYVRSSSSASNFVLSDLSKTSNVEFIIDDTFEASHNYSITFERSDDHDKLFHDRSVYAQVMSQAKANTPAQASSSSDTTSFYATPNKIYLLDDYVRFPTVQEVLREYIPEIIVRKFDKELELFVLNKDNQTFFSQPPLVLIDGVPVISHERLITSSAQTLKSIEIVTKKFFHGPLSYDGIVNFKTYHNDLSGFTVGNEATVFSIHAPQNESSFESPSHSTPEAFKSRTPDFRNVLYWNPEVFVDADGKKLEFYTSDIPGKYVLVIHGLDSHGRPITQKAEFEVQKR